MGLYTWKSGGTSHPEDTLLQFFTDFIRTSGVLSVIGGDFLVEQQASPNMTCKVAIGRAYIKGAATSAYPVRNTASSNVTITSNASGNPRKDAVVLYIDTSASPNSDSTNVATLIVIPGTPAASPVAPTDAEINTAISNKPFIRLANITVASGAGSIVTANIADARPLVTLKKTSNDIVFDTDGATITFNLANGTIHNVTLGGNRTLALSNVNIGDAFVLRIKQDGTGSRTVTWFSGISWDDGVAPTLTTTLNKTDVFGFICTGLNTFDGYICGMDK